MWIPFFSSFNGRIFFVNESFKSDQFVQLYTDASGSIGYGAVYEKQWFLGSWPEPWLGYNITVLELYPIVAAVAVWGHMWRNRSVHFSSDNEAVVNKINKQTSKEHHVMTLLRKLVLTCLTDNVKFTAVRGEQQFSKQIVPIAGGGLSEINTMGHGAASGAAVRKYTSGLRSTIHYLLDASLAPAFRNVYARAWKKLTQFMIFLGMKPMLPVSISV